MKKKTKYEKQADKQIDKERKKANMHASKQDIKQTLLLLLSYQCKGLLTWNDISNAAISTLVDPCLWRHGLQIRWLRKLENMKDIKIKTNTFQV